MTDEFQLLAISDRLVTTSLKRILKLYLSLAETHHNRLLMPAQPLCGGSSKIL